MSTQSSVSQTPGAQPAMAPSHKDPADVAYRRAWWSLALYPVTFVAAFIVGEGMITLLTDDLRKSTSWEVLVAVTPALLVFVTPGVLAVMLGRQAVRLGRRDGMVPAIVGTAMGIGFVGLNGVSYVIQVIFG